MSPAITQAEPKGPPSDVDAFASPRRCPSSSASTLHPDSPIRLGGGTATPVSSPRRSTRVAPTDDFIPSSEKTTTKDNTQVGEAEAPGSMAENEQAAPEPAVDEAAPESMTRDKGATPGSVPQGDQAAPGSMTQGGEETSRRSAQGFESNGLLDFKEVQV